MSLGKLKKVENVSRLFGASKRYWFMKVQSDHGAEEYWLVTDAERAKFRKRAASNLEDNPSRRRGVFEVLKNQGRRFGSDVSYFGLLLRDPGNELETWLLTEPDLERLRKRSDTNLEDIEANKEGWLADLVD